LDTRDNPLPTAPANLFDFQTRFATEADCVRYLEQVRWPEGFVCPTCGAAEAPYLNRSRPLVRECRACRHQVRLTAGTMMHRSKIKLRYWFWAAYLFSTQTSGFSALALKKQLGIKRYETAYMLLRKLRAGTTRPNAEKIGGEHAVELDVAFIGGKTKGLGHGKTKKAMVLVAVEVREGEPPENVNEKKRQAFYAGRIRLRKVPNRSAATIDKFVQDWIEPGTAILTDGDSSFNNLAGLGYVHLPMVTGKDKEKIEGWVPLVHLVISNLKAWILGTFHGAIRKPHLQEYLNEYIFRFNRRFSRMASFRTLLQIGTQVGPVTYAAHYGLTASVRENVDVLPADVAIFGDDGDSASTG
jgi:hypothetical protein